MREIVFRGKRIDDGLWSEGYYIKDTDTKLSYILTIAYIDCREKRDQVSYFEVDPETVGQYTGLKDKNGKRIYEGDVIRFKVEDADQEMFVKVCYGEFVDENDSQFYLGWHVVGNGMTVSVFNGKDDGYDLIGMCEVAGSIHDNPELLEVQNV